MTGFLAGAALATWLAPHRALSTQTVIAMALAAGASFFAQAMATKVLTGEESLTFYHHALVALAATALVIELQAEPVLAYLDLAALGLGTFLAFGRVGCLLVGCCHGRPSGHGVRYGPEHVAEGFPAYLEGVRLFPIPAVEAMGVFVTVVALAAAWLGGAPPGAVLGGLAATYACGRFVLEFGRGDADRRYVFGFSEGQWSSLVVCAVLAATAGVGVLPGSQAYLAATAALAAAFVVTAVVRHRRAVRVDRLRHPRHVRELAMAADRALELSLTGSPATGAAELPVNHVPIGGTSLGLLVSAGVVDSDRGPAIHYAFSHCTGQLAPRAVADVASLLLRLRHDDGNCLLVAGDHGVTHLVVVPSGTELANLPSSGCQGGRGTLVPESRFGREADEHPHPSLRVRRRSRVAGGSRATAAYTTGDLRRRVGADR